MVADMEEIDTQDSIFVFIYSGKQIFFLNHD